MPTVTYEATEVLVIAHPERPEHAEVRAPLWLAEALVFAGLDVRLRVDGWRTPWRLEADSAGLLAWRPAASEAPTQPVRVVEVRR